MKTTFDFTTVDSRLALGAEYTQELKNIVAVWNGNQIEADLGKRYPKVSVRTLDGRITALNYSAQGQWADLPENCVKIVDAFFKAVDTQQLSRKKIHGLLADINKELPDGQKLRLNKDIECGLADCLAGRKMVGWSFQRKLSDINKVIVRTIYAVINQKELKVVYKGLDD